MKKMLLMLLVIVTVFAVGNMKIAFADDDVTGVAGCASVVVDPSSSMEFQQNICNTAEGVAATSCGGGDHGSCSSPKLNDTMPEAGHCVCIGETTEVAPS